MSEVSDENFSLIMPTLKLKHRRKFRQILDSEEIEVVVGFSGNPAIVAGILLGGMSAAFQPSCWAWDAAAAFIVASAGHPVVRLDTHQELDVHEVKHVLLASTMDAQKVPDLLVARNGEAALRYLQLTGPYQAQAPAGLA